MLEPDVSLIFRFTCMPIASWKYCVLQRDFSDLMEAIDVIALHPLFLVLFWCAAPQLPPPL